MGKRNKKAEVITRCIENSVNNWYWAINGAIPKEKFFNACRSYAGNVNYNDAIAIIDETILGSGKKGMLFTENGVYYSTYSGGKYFPYSEPVQFQSRSGYNCIALNEMIEELYTIEVSPSGFEILGGIIGGAINILNEIAEESNVTSNNNEETKYIESKFVESEKKSENNKATLDEHEIVEVLELYKEGLKEIADKLQETISRKVENSEQRADFIFEAIMWQVMNTGDIQLYNHFGHVPSEEELKTINENKDIWINMEREVNEINIAQGLEKINVLKSIKLYSHRIKSGIEECDDYDGDEIYETFQAALKDLKLSLKKIIKDINRTIEKIYS